MIRVNFRGGGVYFPPNGSYFPWHHFSIHAGKKKTKTSDHKQITSYCPNGKQYTKSVNKDNVRNT